MKRFKVRIAAAQEELVEAHHACIEFGALCFYVGETSRSLVRAFAPGSWWALRVEA